MSGTSPKILWGLVATLLLAILAVLLIKVWPVLFPEIARAAPLDPQCDLRTGPCQSYFPDGGAITLSITPREIPALAPLDLEVKLKALTAQRVEVDIVGISMDMGFHRATLERAADHRYVGQTTLPVCVSDRMDWEARVLAHGNAGIVAAPFRFSTFRNPP
jgi:hypothetical protein